MKKSREERLNESIELLRAVESNLTHVLCDIQDEIDYLFEMDKESRSAYFLWENLGDIDDILEVIRSGRTDLEKSIRSLEMINAL